MNELAVYFINFLMALLLAPLLSGIINRTKAKFAGRQGQPLLQLYYDIFKLLRKGSVYSRSTTALFRWCPIISLAAIIAAGLFVPFAFTGTPLGFACDLLIFAYFLGLARFMTVLGAMETASSFEGMGASREMQYSTLAEPALLLGLAALAIQTGNLSLSGMLTGVIWEPRLSTGAVLFLVALAIFIVLLCENCRVPFDDPNTHLELTMIHEVMILDYSGPDLGMILYGASLKLWIMGTVLVAIALPWGTENIWLNTIFYLAGMLLLGITIGITESIMARVRLLKVPQILIGAAALAALGILLLSR